MFKFVEQGSTSCHENRKSIQRKSRQRLLTRTIDLERRWPDSLFAQGAPGTGRNTGRRGGVGWGGGYLRWTSVLFKGRGESTILPDAQRYRDRDEL